MESLDNYANGVKFRCNKCGQEYFFRFKIGEEIFTLKGDNMKKGMLYGGKIKGFSFWKDFNAYNVKKDDGDSHQFLEKNLILKERYWRRKSDNSKTQSFPHQTSPNADFSNEIEHNISLKESSSEDSQIPNGTSLNNNIMFNNERCLTR